MKSNFCQNIFDFLANFFHGGETKKVGLCNVNFSADFSGSKQHFHGIGHIDFGGVHKIVEKFLTLFYRDPSLPYSCFNG